MEDDDIRQLLHETYRADGRAPASTPRPSSTRRAARASRLVTSLLAVVAALVVAVPVGVGVLLRAGSPGSVAAGRATSIQDLHMYDANDGWAWAGGNEILHTTSGVHTGRSCLPRSPARLIVGIAWVNPELGANPDDDSRRVRRAREAVHAHAVDDRRRWGDLDGGTAVPSAARDRRGSRHSTGAMQISISWIRCTGGCSTARASASVLRHSSTAPWTAECTGHRWRCRRRPARPPRVSSRLDAPPTACRSSTRPRAGSPVRAASPRSSTSRTTAAPPGRRSRFPASTAPLSSTVHLTARRVAVRKHGNESLFVTNDGGRTWTASIVATRKLARLRRCQSRLHHGARQGMTTRRPSSGRLPTAG